ncbi:MAG: phosphocholine cytidylyltransferase family protein [Pseudomonadales bacterium]|nr:phosphocholine cytidylyltransferase family protein [Pseudomonadales bacterium]MCP5182552.1 phosphocholine cytidylyltransferase family protein [Pseudomonadales bacterium]
MKVIILSAGQGRRLLPYTENCPKCALQLGERSALEWQLKALHAGGANEVVVVAGFQAPQVRAIAAACTDLPVRVSHNPFYALSDNLGTCWVARHEMHVPFVVVNGDTMFEAGIFRRLLAAPSKYPITLVTNVKSGYDADDMKVIVDGDRLVRVDKRLDVNAVSGESIGMIRFSDIGAALFRRQLESMMENESTLKRWYLSAIDELAAQGYVGTVSTGGLGWCEIDDPKDLAHAARVVPGWWRETAELPEPLAVTAG